MSDETKYLTLERLTELGKAFTVTFAAQPHFPIDQQEGRALGFAILDILADITAGMKLGPYTRFGATDAAEEATLLKTPWIRSADEAN